jgi:hypothetical protein
MSDKGYAQAARYKHALPWIMDMHNLHVRDSLPWGDIRHVYVHDPRPWWGTTCNPFESVFPLIRGDISSSDFTPISRNRVTPEHPMASAKLPSISDVNLYALSDRTKGELKDVMTSALKADLGITRPHSTLCCFTGNTLYGPKNSAELREGTLLHKMNKLYGITDTLVLNPQKGVSVYVYSRDGSGKGIMDYFELSDNFPPLL